MLTKTVIIFLNKYPIKTIEQSIHTYKSDPPLLNAGNFKVNVGLAEGPL